MRPHDTVEAILRDDPQVAVQALPGELHRAGSGPAQRTGQFISKADAEAWAALERRLIEWEDWSPPAQRKAKQARRHPDPADVGDHLAAGADCVRGLKPKPVSEYQRYLDLRNGPPGRAAQP